MLNSELNGAGLAATNHEDVATQYFPSVLQEQVNNPGNQVVDDHRKGGNRASGP